MFTLPLCVITCLLSLLFCHFLWFSSLCLCLCLYVHACVFVCLFVSSSLVPIHNLVRVHTRLLYMRSRVPLWNFVWWHVLSVIQYNGTTDTILNLHLSLQETLFFLVTCLLDNMLVCPFVCFLCFFAFSFLCLLALCFFWCIYTLGVRVQLLKCKIKRTRMQARIPNFSIHFLLSGFFWQDGCHALSFNLQRSH